MRVICWKGLGWSSKGPNIKYQQSVRHCAPDGEFRSFTDLRNPPIDLDDKNNDDDNNSDGSNFCALTNYWVLDTNINAFNPCNSSLSTIIILIL